jgi:hypothetical protein
VVALQALSTAVPSVVVQSESSSAALSPGLAAAARFVGIVIGSLLAVGLVVGVAPEFTRERVDELRSEPAVGLASGVVAGVVVPFVLVLIGATGIGLLVAIPGFLGLFVLGVVGTGVATLWVGSLIVATDDTARRAVAGTVVLAVLGAIPLIGQLLTTLVSTCGLGVVARASYEGYRS